MILPDFFWDALVYVLAIVGLIVLIVSIAAGFIGGLNQSWSKWFDRGQSWPDGSGSDPKEPSESEKLRDISSWL